MTILLWLLAFALALSLFLAGMGALDIIRDARSDIAIARRNARRRKREFQRAIRAAQKNRKRNARRLS